MELRFAERGNKKILQFREVAPCMDDVVQWQEWQDVPCEREEPKWCEHIKEVKRSASSSIQGFYWGYYKSSGAYPQNICEEWNACPICGAKKPSEAGVKKGEAR